MEDVPPGGFPVRLKVGFFTTAQGKQRLQLSSTCRLQLNLLKGHMDPDQFKDMMVYVLQNTYGFRKIGLSCKLNHITLYSGADEG